MANHYQILDVDTDAEPNDIKAAYRKLSKRYHPDITGDPKGHLFQLVNEAYEVLSNAEKRAAYDRSLASEDSHGHYSSYSPQEEDNSPTSSSTAGNSSDIPPARVNWNKMEWYQREYKDIKEHVILPKPGLIKGIAGGAGYVLGTAFLGLFSFVVIELFPILAVILAVAAIVGWFKYARFELDKTRFGMASAAFPAYSIYALLVGLGGSSGPHPALAIFECILLVGLFLLGFWSAHRWQYWQDVKQTRGPMVISSKDILEYASWGKAGQLDDAAGKFTDRNIALGATGEKMTAELMNNLLLIPGTRILHGLKFPGSETADVDHAIINGNKIVLVDSKMWSGGNYRWGYDGLIVRSNGATSADLHTNFPYAVREYQRDITEAIIRGRILIHSNNGNAVSVDNSGAEASGVGSTRLCTAQEFFEETGNWFAENNTGIIHRGLMNTLLYRMK